MTDSTLARKLEIFGKEMQNHADRMGGAQADDAGAKLSQEVISAQTAEQAKKSTVFITVSSDSGPRGFGSGFIVGDGKQVVTNLHVVGDAKSIDIKTPSGEHFAARVSKVDEFSDLAVLDVEGLHAQSKAVKLGSSQALVKGDTLVASGHPNGVSQATSTFGNYRSTDSYKALQPERDVALWMKVTEGVYTEDADSYKRDAEKFLGTSRLHAKLGIDHGNSGGPVSNARGETVGVATNITPDKPGESFLVPSENVAKLLQDSDKRFNFVYEKESNFDRYPVLTTAKDAAILGLGYRFRPVAAPLMGATYGIDLYDDLKMATGSNLYGNRNKYIAEAAMDGAAVTGGVLSLIPKTKLVGFGLVGARVLYDVGNDFFGGDPVFKKVVRTDRAEPQRTGEPLYWSLIDRVNASSKQLAPQKQNFLAPMKRH